MVTWMRTKTSLIRSRQDFGMTADTRQVIEEAPAAGGFSKRPSQRVTVISGTWPPMRCGIAPYSRNLSLGLKSEGHGVQVVTGKGAVETQQLDLTVVNDWRVTTMVRLFKRLRSNPPPHIIQLEHPTRATRTKLSAYLLPLIARIMTPQHRVVTTFHYLKPVSFKTALLRMFFLLPAATSHAIVVTTEMEARYARRFFRRKLIEVIPAGLTFPISRVTRETRIATRQVLGFRESDFVVAYAGFLVPNKGIETLIRAMKQLPPTTKLLAIGGTYDAGHSYLGRLKVAAERAGVEKRIVWMGEAPEADFGSLLSAADCAALPFDEGGCLKRSTLLMALAAGLPVVTTDGPERDQVMRSGENLLLVPPRDPLTLADALSLLEKDDGLRKRLVESSREILDMVNWESIVGRHVALYERLEEGSACWKLEPALD